MHKGLANDIIQKLNIFGDRSYYVVSILIILCSIVLFMWSFERRKPRTREVVVISVMISLAVVGRLTFFMMPQFKPCAAIIIIAGIMLGKQAGFMCGAITAFASDFFFGQGPWTPWQMIAFGLIGLVSAIVFGEDCLESKGIKYKLCFFGFVITFWGYGIIMDTATVLMYTDSPNIKALITAYAAGVYFNLVHGISTVFFLWVLAMPMLKKIRRVKIKYDMHSNNNKLMQ